MDGNAATATRLEFLEAVHDCESPEIPWLEKLVEAGARVWGRPKFAVGYTYDASDPANLRINPPVYLDARREVVELVEYSLQFIQKLPAEAVAATYRSVPVGYGKSIGVLDPETMERMRRVGASDVFAFNAIDPTGKACAIGLGVDKGTVTAGDVELFQRLTAHMASAYRCRRRMTELDVTAFEGWEALFHPDGRLLDARGPAQPQLERTALTRAANSMEGVRRHKIDDEPTVAWRPRVRSRWTFVDAFMKDGERYIVARENQAWAPGLVVLTERERQVVVGTAIGKTPKEIAYELGISDSTVRVLMSRARTRLGVKTTDQLFALPIIRALRGEAPPVKD
jgi:DNA-binding CsgD family transcriptional regulator